MSLHNFFALPLMSVALVTTSAYSSPQQFEFDQSPNVIEVSQVQTVEEVNPTPEEEPAPEPVHEVQTPPKQVSSEGKIIYTQSEVRLYPAMVAICSCESGRQFHADGSVVRGIVNPQDIGMCQINLKYHAATAEALGFDLFTEEGNIRYANNLYDRQGAQPWYWSKSCHGQG